MRQRLLIVSLLVACGGCSIVTDFDAADAAATVDSRTDAAGVDRSRDGALADGPLVDAAPDAPADALSACRTASDCDDGIACTVDRCSSAGLCLHERDDEVCKTDNLCVDDVCRPRATGADAKGCVHPPRVTCTGETPLCDPETGKCVECLADTDCAPPDCCTPSVCSNNRTCRTATLCGRGGRSIRCCQTTMCPATLVACETFCPIFP